MWLYHFFNTPSYPLNDFDLIQKNHSRIKYRIVLLSCFVARLIQNWIVVIFNVLHSIKKESYITENEMFTSNFFAVLDLISITL